MISNLLKELEQFYKGMYCEDSCKNWCGSKVNNNSSLIGVLGIIVAIYSFAKYIERIPQNLISPSGKFDP